jgi:hypothetical protein
LSLEYLKNLWASWVLMAHACHPKLCWRLRFQANTGNKAGETPSQRKKAGWWWCMPAIPVMARSLK